MANYNLGEARGRIVLETDLASLKDGQKAIDDAKQNAERAAQSQSEAWKKTGTAATVAGAAAAAGFGVAVAAASNFEFKLSGIQAVSGATASEMDSLRDKALQLGRDTAYSAAESATAMEELVKAGLSVDSVLNGAADATVALAAAGGIELPDAAAIAANAMNQFNLSAEDLVGVTDKIAGAANSSAIDVNNFGMSMTQVGAVANLAGLSFDDTALAITAMGNAGIKGGDAGTSLKSMLLRLNPTTQEATDLMRELGIITEDGTNQFYDAEGSLKSLSDVSEVLKTSLEGQTDAQKQATLTTLFGSDAIRAAAVVADQGAEGLDNLAASMDKTTAADVAATRLDNMQGSITILMGSLETMMITIGQQLTPVVKQMVDGITEAVNWFANLSEGTKSVIIGVGLLSSGLLLAFGVTIKVIQGVQAATATIKALNLAANAAKIGSLALAAAQRVAAAAQWALNAAQSANPIGLIITLVAALVAAIIWFFTQTELGQTIWANFMQWLQEAWTNIGAFFEGLWNGIVDVFTTVWGAIQTAIGAVVDWFQTYVWPIFQFVIDAITAYFMAYYMVVMFIWNGIMTVVGAVVDWFMTYVWPTIAAFIGFIVKLFQFFWGLIQLGWNAMVTAIGAVVEFLVNLVVGYFTWWFEQTSKVLTAIWDFITAVWDGIVAAVTPVIEGFVNWIVDLWEKFQLGWRILWAAVQQTIQTIWNAIKSVVEPIVQGIVNFITNTWGTIVSFVTDVFNNVKDAIMGPIEDALDFIGGIKDQVIGFFADAGKWLWDAGANIIQGFLDGLGSMWNEIGNFFTDLTNMIPEIKGPPAKDKVLLTDNGELIMRSLYNGLASGMGDVEALLNGMNATIPASVQQDILANVGGGSAGKGTQVVLNLEYHAAEGDGTTTREDVLAMLGHATELVREELS